LDDRNGIQAVKNAPTTNVPLQKMKEANQRQAGKQLG